VKVPVQRLRHPICPHTLGVDVGDLDIPQDHISRSQRNLCAESHRDKLPRFLFLRPVPESCSVQ
jgi:hypothetical protein